MKEYIASYISVLFSLVDDYNLDIDKLILDLKMIKDSLSDEEIVKFLKAKTISSKDKVEIVLNSLKGFEEKELSFVRILIENNRILELDSIIHEFVLAKEEKEKCKRIRITIAKELSHYDKDKLLEEIKAKFFNELLIDKLIVDWKIDSNIIGGYILEFDSKVYDASILKRGNDLRKYLEK